MKNNKEYLDKVSKIIEPPYFYEMVNYGIKDINEQEYILCKVFGVNVSIETIFSTFVVDDSNNTIYCEHSIYCSISRKMDIQFSNIHEK